VFGKLVLIFVLVPLADLMLLMMLSSYTGWQFSVALVVLSGILGAYLARWQSTLVRRDIAKKMQQNQMSAGLLTDGAMIFFAAGLLLTPGFITDAVGLSLLIPACRNWYKRRFSAWIKKNFRIQTFTSTTGQRPSARPHDPNIIDGEVIDRTTTDSTPDPAGDRDEHGRHLF
jgi:UPF0716 protein FxsA